ncbi:hypothetical protein KEM48_008416 [Puccinia striiformis f. sp. tritici PST-130]|nr:hypothetical protein KEM48_008416 [Puccinia striiformis f. sp. tritici PST-130]
MSHIIFDQSTYETPDTTPMPDRDPMDPDSPLVTDPIAHMLPGNGFEAPHLVNVTTDFRLYIADQSKEGQEQGRFQEIVAAQCNIEYAHTQPVIMRSIAFGKPAISWTFTIPKIPNWKAPGKPAGTEQSFRRWMAALRNGCKTKAILLLKMPNPNALQSRAPNKDILQRNALRDAARAMTAPSGSQSQSGSQSRSRAPADDLPSGSDSESSDIDANDFDHINLPGPLQQEALYLVSVGNCQEWAQALIDCKPGVSLHSPPRSLNYQALSARQFAALASGWGSSTTPRPT